MCGIVGIASSNRNVGPLIVDCLKKLEYRGYDSVGVAIVGKHGILIRKGAGKIDSVDEAKCLRCLEGYVGIGHTRWATHGPPTDENAHPHTDCESRIAVVHNGIIENYMELKKMLIAKGHVFRSATDTEVIAHLLEENSRNNSDFFDVFRRTVRSLSGSYALAVVSVSAPGKIFFARKHSPLVIGLGKDVMFVASDIPAFLDFTNKVIVLNDGELGYIDSGSVYMETIEGKPIDVSSRILVVPWTAEQARKEGFPHFMLKEIHEQPLVIGETIRGFGIDYEKGAEMLVNGKNIFVTAAGTSFHASLYFALLTMKLSSQKVIPFISSEYEVYAHVASEDDVLLAVSQSGETIDTLAALRAFKQKGAKVVSLTNVIGSVIARESDRQIYMKAGPEIGVAATKTFTVQLTALTWLSILISHHTGKIGENELKEITSSLKELPSLVEKTINLYSGWSKELSNFMAKKASAYYLSRGLGVPIALEGALKLKEIAYIHAEGYPAGESKHGPIALVEKNFPVVFVSIEKSLEKRLHGNVEEMKARGAHTIGIIPKDSELRELFDRTAILPSSNEFLTPILGVVPLQLLAYYTAVEKGYDPDKPRNLAKTVTVE